MSFVTIEGSATWFQWPLSRCVDSCGEKIKLREVEAPSSSITIGHRGRRLCRHADPLYGERMCAFIVPKRSGTSPY